MIRGYPEPPSVEAGQEVLLRLSGDADRAHVAVYRLGRNTGPPAAVLGPWPLRDVPAGRCDRGWDWPAYAFRVPADWPSGIYLAHLHACRGGGHQACVPPQPPPVDGRDGRLLFVVRPSPNVAPAPLLYKVPLSTYHAYNATGGGSLYQGSSMDRSTGRRRVTLYRPGGGTGGDLSFPAASDVYDPATPREGVAHWDLPFVQWLEQEGFRADFCTDLDLDRHPGLLVGRTLLVTAGHDEYWTAGLRAHVQRFLASGGNAAFFAGNACFWRIEVHHLEGLLSCRHPPSAAADADQWWLSDPETRLTGVSYRYGGGWWRGPRDPVGYTVVDAGHWIFAGTSLRNGDEFGGDERLVGYECDGAPLTGPRDAPRARRLAGAPPVHLLALARLHSGWQERAMGDDAAATVVTSRPGGTVVSVGTTDWPRVLAAGEPHVATITRNVLGRLSVPSIRMHAPEWASTGCTVPVWVPADGASGVEWGSSAGVVSGHGPVVSLTLPAEPLTVTIWATVLDTEGPVGFATAQLDVLSSADAAQLRLLAAVRALAAGTPPDPSPSVPDEPGNLGLTDDRWDPLQDGLRRRLTAGDVDVLRGLIEQVVTAVATLSAELNGRS